MTNKLEDSLSWIVCWTLKDSGEDGWQPFESYSQAKTFFDDLWKDETYTQSLTAVMESTDFDVHPAFYAEYESTTLENHDDA